MKLFPVLNASELSQINSICEAEGNWIDGSSSAIGRAKDKKDNFQITQADPIFTKILPYIHKAHQIELVKSYTFLKEIVDPRLASYKQGGHYDWHVDIAHLANRRTDLSFTIFLMPKDSYEGGEMSIRTPSGNKMIKGDAGQMLVYPSGLMHKVHPVTSGERRVIVGWVNSNIKLEEYRDRLFSWRLLLSKFQKMRDENLIDAEIVEEFNQLYYQIVRDYS